MACMFVGSLRTGPIRYRAGLAGTQEWCASLALRLFGFCRHTEDSRTRHRHHFYVAKSTLGCAPLQHRAWSTNYRTPSATRHWQHCQLQSIACKMTPACVALVFSLLVLAILALRRFVRLATERAKLSKTIPQLRGGGILGWFPDFFRPDKHRVVAAWSRQFDGIFYYRMLAFHVSVIHACCSMRHSVKQGAEM
jgi:hypothetical protein